MPLGAADQAAITALRRTDAERTLAGLRRFSRTSKWVASSNRYTANTVYKIKQELQSGSIVNPRHLAQYIAASGLLHCVDGWSYLGRSIVALLRGDPHRARHLAYYAELRAGMSLLATEGIGVFSTQHFLINSANSVARLRNGGGTHVFLWECLEHWSGQPASGDLFARIVTPYGRPLAEWLAPAGGVRTIAPQAQSWFRQWGIDLRVFPADRDARNVSSYRPDGIGQAWANDPIDSLDFVSELWSALEPAPHSRFEGIDAQVLRLCLESVFRATTGAEPSAHSQQFRAFVEPVVANQNLSDAVHNHWIEFITRQRLPTDLKILSMSKLSPNQLIGSETAVLSRAALLLRVASGSATDLIQSAGFTAANLEFWWGKVGEARGLWHGPKTSDSLLELWDDIVPLLSEIGDFRSRHQTSPPSFFHIADELGGALSGLGSSERVAIWGTVP